MYTIQRLLAERPTVAKYEVLMRADRLLEGRGGRYYQGQLTSDEASTLVVGVEGSPRSISFD